MALTTRVFLDFPIYWEYSSQLTHIFQRGRYTSTTNHPLYHRYSIDITIHIPHIFHRNVHWLMISVSVGLFEASAGAGGEGKFLFEVADGRGAEGGSKGC